MCKGLNRTEQDEVPRHTPHLPPNPNKYAINPHAEIITTNILCPAAKPLPDTSNALAQTTGSVLGVGIGVSSLDASNKFYSSLFGFGTGLRFPFTAWDEDIMLPPGNTLPIPVLLPMKFKTGGSSIFKEDRPVKDLPVMLKLTVPDAKVMVDKIVAAGGKAASNVKGGKEGVLYAKDLDGYLLELVSGGPMAFTGVAYGSSDPGKSASFFAKLTGTPPLPVASAGPWNLTTVTKKKFDISFLDFGDGRPTKKLPLKINWATPSVSGFMKTITEEGGSMVDLGLGVLSSFASFGYDNVDQILLEMNPVPGTG